VDTYCAGTGTASTVGLAAAPCTRGTQHCTTMVCTGSNQSMLPLYAACLCFLAVCRELFHACMKLCEAAVGYRNLDRVWNLRPGWPWFYIIACPAPRTSTLIGCGRMA
jgi:hypothetical protein